MGGAIISGELISERQYFEGMADDVMKWTITGTVKPDDANAFEELRNAFADGFRSRAATFDVPKGAPETYVPPTPNVIHLKNAIWLYPNGKAIPENRGVLWRGKLSAVDGFCLGEIRPTK